MWPFRGEPAQVVERKPYVYPSPYRSYQVPADQTWESYRWLVEHLWAEATVDEFVTDDDAERDQLVQWGLKESYEVRVTDRSDGAVVLHEG